MASSSQVWTYDVFLCFRGKDIRNTFAGDLYSALEEKGIYTFKNDETLSRGESMVPSVLKAIEESRIAIIVFTKTFAYSYWHLDEVECIMRCKVTRDQVVMPIFYDVDYSEVRRQTGKYGEAFVKYEMENNVRVNSWKKTLVDACSIFGWNSRDSNDTDLIKSVVDTISNRLYPNKNRTQLQSSENLEIHLRRLLSATNNFSEECIIGKGGFGNVYKAQYEHGIVAIKKLDRRFGQGGREFNKEIRVLSTYKHKNLVSLVGFCKQDGEKILVYGYESNGSLNQHILRQDLNWIQRLRICLDVARGLAYLHDDVGTEHRILHCDIKSANILLDENFTAKISDFGLSKIALSNMPHTDIISYVCGTFGYCDPEFYEHGTLTQRSDVYSFGVVMFEVLCGKLIRVSKHLDELFSAKLAQKYYERGTLDEIIDSDLRRQMNSNSLITFAAIAHQCLKCPRKERPTMVMVVQQLEKALAYQQHESSE